MNCQSNKRDNAAAEIREYEETDRINSVESSLNQPQSHSVWVTLHIDMQKIKIKDTKSKKCLYSLDKKDTVIEGKKEIKEYLLQE